MTQTGFRCWSGFPALIPFFNPFFALQSDLVCAILGLAMRHCFKSVLLLAGLLATAALSHAQPYDISWYTVDGGGGSSSGGTFSLTGTIGQPDAGHMTGGNYTLDGGFWGIFAAVQTPGAPLLTIRPAFPNVIVSWPVASSNFTLQENSNLTATNWATFSYTIVTNSGSNTVTVPVSGNTFFRLKQ